MTTANVTVQSVPARKLAAVRRRVAIGSVATAWRPALDQVWAFLRAHAGLRTDGHNVFLYHHPVDRDAPMDVHFGVEVVRTFEPEGDVLPVETPAGDVATAVHAGSYAQLKVTHDAIHAWRAREGRNFAGLSWEIYGDWSDDPAKLETTVCYLLGP
jgi:effector-binding domain-containing protein